MVVNKNNKLKKTIITRYIKYSSEYKCVINQKPDFVEDALPLSFSEEIILGHKSKSHFSIMEFMQTLQITSDSKKVPPQHWLQIPGKNRIYLDYIKL